MTSQRMRVTAAPAWLLALVLVLGGGHRGAQPPRPAADAADCLGQLETIQIRPNVYVIFGAGSNITVHLGEDGVILVDAGTAALAPQVVAAVKALTPSQFASSSTRVRTRTT